MIADHLATAAPTLDPAASYLVSHGIGHLALPLLEAYLLIRFMQFAAAKVSKQHSTAQHSTAQHSTAHSTAQHSTASGTRQLAVVAHACKSGAQQCVRWSSAPCAAAVQMSRWCERNREARPLLTEVLEVLPGALKGPTVATIGVLITLRCFSRGLGLGLRVTARMHAM
jgi:hypothetical protein